MPNIKQIKTPNNTTYDILDANAYHINDAEETNKNNLNNDDFIPFYETSGTAAPKKMKVSNLINRLKTLLSLGTASTKAYTTSVTQNSNDLVTSGAVWTAIDELPEPMVFKGSLGTGGTITSLPTDGTATIGDTYKVMKDGTYAGTSAKVGDTFICVTKTSSANTWTLIPSGDEPSGTVTSVKIQATSPIAIDSSAAITTSGTRTISHETSGVTAGSYGDSSAKTPSYGGTFKVPYITVNDTGHVTGISAHNVTIPASDNTDRYVNSASFADDTTSNSSNPVKMTLTRAGSDTIAVTGNIPKVSSTSAGVVPKGAAVSSQSQSTKFLRSDGTWQAPSYTTNTDTTYSFADGTNQFTVTPSGSTASTIKVTPQLKIDGITSDVTDKEINCYGECSTAAGTAAKAVSVTKGTFALAAGSKVIVKFTNANTANNPTLNVNSKGAKNIFHNGARITTGTNKALLAGTIELVYDGTQFQLVGNYIDTDTTYSAGTGISFDGTTINHSNSITAGTAKGDNSKTLSFGGTFTIPSVTYDAQGHVTAKGTTTMTMPSNPNTDTKVTQTNNTDDKYYRVLLSSTDNNNEDTNTVNKSGEITVNPSTGRLRCKRLAIENNESNIFPLYMKLTDRGVISAGQDVRIMQVQYKTSDGSSNYTHSAYPISVIGNDAGNANNTGIRLGSHNGTTIVGAGESSLNFASAQSKYNNENLYMVADGAIELYTGLPNDATSFGGHITVNSSGNITVDSANGEALSPGNYNNLVIGNNKGTSAAGHKGGRIYLYSDTTVDELDNMTSYSAAIVPGGLSAARTFTLPDKSGIVATRNFNTCVIGHQSDTVDANATWYKVATWVITDNNSDTSSMIAVSNTYTGGVSGNQNAGLLYLHFRTYKSGNYRCVQHANLNFVSNKGFNTEHFALVFKDNYSSTEVTAALYTSINVQYMTRRFTFLDDGTRINNTQRVMFDETNQTKESNPITTVSEWTYGIYAS